jgi:hypothetical protein
MAYFNHAFQKTFVGTNGFTGLNEGKLGTPGNILSGGQFAFVNAKTWELQNTATPPETCCNLILAAGSIYQRDKIGPYHGGYLESNKSKEINPKYVSKFYRVDPCDPQNNIIHIGKTLYTSSAAISLAITTAGSDLEDGVYTDIPLVDTTAPTGSGLIATITVTGNEVVFVQITNGGTGWVTNDVVTTSSETIPAIAGETGVQPTFTVTAGIGANCCKDFLCGETYSLRIDVKGSPALRFLNHNAYLTVSHYTGCCVDNDGDPTTVLVPTPVDSTLVMIGWANQIVNSPLISPFIYPVVSDESGTLWYPPGTDAAFLASEGVDTWDHYISTGHVDGECAGLVLNGAYVDTKFGDCTFQITDFYEKEPVRLYASETDLNGDPCVFNGVCVVTECQGRQAMGLGESVARDVILSEQYRQNFFSSDFRIREITQGIAVFDYIDRLSSYTRYYILHNVPRFNNPTGVFDNDQYLLQVITDGTVAAFQEFVEGWLSNCSECTELEVTGCITTCNPVIPTPFVPVNPLGPVGPCENIL